MPKQRHVAADISMPYEPSPSLPKRMTAKRSHVCFLVATTVGDGLSMEHLPATHTQLNDGTNFIVGPFRLDVTAQSPLRCLMTGAPFVETAPVPNEKKPVAVAPLSADMFPDVISLEFAQQAWFPW